MPNQKRILIVDDDPDILDALKMIFDLEGYITDTISKGAETFKTVAKFKPDAIILDVLLSGEDGRVICKKLKSDTSTKNIPVIMVSAHPDADKSTMAVGANDFLAKPFDIAEIVHTVEKYL